jgi:hypothetical protein
MWRNKVPAHGEEEGTWGPSRGQLGDRGRPNPWLGGRGGRLAPGPPSKLLEVVRLTGAARGSGLRLGWRVWLLPGVGLG